VRIVDNITRIKNCHTLFEWILRPLFICQLIPPGVNFTNCSMSSLYAHISQKCKKTHWWLDCLFVLLGSARVTAAHKMLVKLTPRLENFNFEKCWTEFDFSSILEKYNSILFEFLSFFAFCLSLCFHQAERNQTIKMYFG